jgi:hypothetical protein
VCSRILCSILSLLDGPANAQTLRNLTRSKQRQQCADALMALAMLTEPDGTVDARKRMLLAKLASELDTARADALFVAAKAACDAAFTGHGVLDRHTIFGYSRFKECATHPHAPPDLKARAEAGAAEAWAALSAKLRAVLQDDGLETLFELGGNSPTKILRRVTKSAMDLAFPDLNGLETTLKALVERAQGTFPHHSKVLRVRLCPVVVA